MRLTDEEVKAARIAVSWYVHDSNVAGRSIYPPTRQLRDRLNKEYELSRARHETGSGTVDPGDSKPIGTNRVAQILGWPKRQVQRLAAQLGGEKVEGRWIFPEQVVLDYREEATCRSTQQAKQNSQSSQTSRASRAS